MENSSTMLAICPGENELLVSTYMTTPIYVWLQHVKLHLGGAAVDVNGINVSIHTE
jgi:hypothetical protein